MAPPPKVLPLTVTGVVPQVLPEVLLNIKVGGLAQPHDTVNGLPVFVQPEAFLTVIVYVPLATPVNEVLVWNAPPFRLYSIPAPVGLVTVTTALPAPRAQSTVCVGAAGVGG